MIEIEDIDILLESQEKMVRGLRPGTEKKVLWTRRIASMMGDNVTLHNPSLTDRDDPSHHGIIGDILSPSQTTIAVSKIINWLAQI